VNHQPLKKKPEEEIKNITENTSRQIATAHTTVPQYDLDFHSPTF
jgi:hypothetical protein